MTPRVILKKIRKRLRAKAWAVGMARPRRVECNLCQWSGLRFMSDSWHKFTVCPVCGSQVRHRLLVAALDELYRGALDRKRVLHFAPEIPLVPIVKRAAATYTTADFLHPKADLKLDISSMPSVAAGAYDAVIACDVLEHVPDDKAAMRELFRVLAPGGHAILTVPQKDRLATTFEDASATSRADRERLFGEPTHLRIYGDDFSAMLASAGFRVTAVDESRFSPRAVSRHVLAPPVLSTRPLATNFRKVFFAQR